MSFARVQATAYIGLGSNLGDRLEALRAAVQRLSECPRVSVDFASGVASLYESAPQGAAAGPALFLNSAVRLRTTRSPHELLESLLSVEASLGRPEHTREGPRTLDLDLLLYDDLVLHDESLTIPHPRLHERRFVLEPLSEIAGKTVHPILKATIETLNRRYHGALRSEGPVLVAGPEWPNRLSAEK